MPHLSTSPVLLLLCHPDLHVPLAPFFCSFTCPFLSPRLSSHCSTHLPSLSLGPHLSALLGPHHLPILTCLSYYLYAHLLPPPSPLPCPVCEWLMVPTGPPHLYMRSMSISGSSWCSFIFTVSVRIMCRLNIRSWTWSGGRAGSDVARVVGLGVKQGWAKTLVVDGGAGVPWGSPARQRCCPAAPRPPRHR